MKKLKERWGITSDWQLVVIFIVFAINGTLSAKISRFLMNLLGLSTQFFDNLFNNKILSTSLYWVVLLVLVLPLYPFMLIAFGYLFGQFEFFFKFGKKMLKSMGLGFIFKT